tara:strand:+ start:4570 stop:5253 length:684 start_codon:yes stop_codon:yes gene_type:complete
VHGAFYEKSHIVSRQVNDIDEVDIYPVTNRSLYNGKSDEEVIAALAGGGAKIVQLREKTLPDRDLFELALLYRRETIRHNMIFIVNDRPDICLLTGADGVHLGSTDLPLKQVRKLLGPDTIIGASSHDVEEAIEKQSEGATYVNMGPLFETPTKPGAITIGLDPVREARMQLSIPFTVMGGIAESNIDDVLKAGAKHIGVITAIFKSTDISKATSKFSKIIRDGRCQ